MQKLSNSKLISLLSIFLILLLIAKIISLALWWYLPSEGVEYNAKKSYQPTYHRVDFKNMLKKAKIVEARQKNSTSKAYSIDSLILSGLYGNEKRGFAIVAKKIKPKETTLVSVGEEFAGYKLKAIGIDYIVFTKNKKEYRLNLAELKANLKSSVQRVHQVTQMSYNEDDAEHEVTRADIKHYSKNPSKIWKDISISPVKKNKKIVGFKVTRIKANSKMAQLGLKKGDIMIRANNIKLTSFNDAIKLYKKIDKIDTIAIVVLRDNQEKEIIYEIR